MKKGRDTLCLCLFLAPTNAASLPTSSSLDLPCVTVLTFKGGLLPSVEVTCSPNLDYGGVTNASKYPNLSGLVACSHEDELPIPG